MATIWDMLGLSGTDNMEAFGSNAPVAEPLVVDPLQAFEASRDFTMTDPGVVLGGHRMDDPNVIHDPKVEVAPPPEGRQRKPLIDAQTMKRVLAGEISLTDAALPSRQLLKTPTVKRGRDLGRDSEDPSMWDKFKKGAGDYFGDEENMANLAMAFNTMRLEPDQGITSAMAAKAQSARKGKKSKLNREAVIASLVKMGREDLAKYVADGSLDPKDAINAALKKTTPSALAEKIALMKEDPETFAAAKDAGLFGGTTVNVGGGQMTPGRKKYDEEWGKDLQKWNSGGGADTVGNIAKVERVLTALQSGESLTGPILGQMPDFAMAFVNPEAVAAREAVEGVVQRNLKAVLGAQFTEKEGEKLIKRAYNPTLSEEENAERLTVLIKQMKIAARQKNEAAEYFKEHGTMIGFVGELPNWNDFHNALDNFEASSGESYTSTQKDVMNKYGVKY